MKPVIFTIDKSIFQQLEIGGIQSTDYREIYRTIEPLDFNAYEFQTPFRLIRNYTELYRNRLFDKRSINRRN